MARGWMPVSVTLLGERDAVEGVGFKEAREVSSRLQMRCSKVGGSGANEAPPHFSPVKSQMRQGSRSLGSVLPSPTPQLSLRSPLSFHPVTKTNKQLQSTSTFLQHLPCLCPTEIL